MNFGIWPKELHWDYDQVQRIIASADKKLARGIVAIDRTVPSMTIKGSGMNPYLTTLDTCTCGDFMSRHKPCKHIYRLAKEMGLMDDLPICSSFDVKAELESYKERYKTGEVPAEVYVKIGKALS